jgi:hypothetical protein
MWEFPAMPYDPRPANAARLKMFHLIADKIERDADCLQMGFDNVIALEPLDLALNVEGTGSR